jgi:hypothetical protein
LSHGSALKAAVGAVALPTGVLVAAFDVGCTKNQSHVIWGRGDQEAYSSQTNAAYRCVLDGREPNGTDKSTIFALKNGYSVLRTTPTGIAAGIVVELWGNTRQSE